MKTPRATTTPKATRRHDAETDLQQQEHAEIERSVRDYVDGWYEGAASRMARALHPSLAKRAFLVQPNGEFLVDSTSATEMIDLTEAGVGRKNARSGQQNEVIVFEVVGNMATAKSISPDYIDLLHLIKLNGEWRIVNVLWTPNAPAILAPSAP